MYKKNETDWEDVATMCLLYALILFAAVVIIFFAAYMFAETEYIQIARCSEIPYWEVRRDRLGIYDIEGSIRMTDEEAAVECPVEETYEIQN